MFSRSRRRCGGGAYDRMESAAAAASINGAAEPAATSFEGLDLRRLREVSGEGRAAMLRRQRLREARIVVGGAVVHAG